ELLPQKQVLGGELGTRPHSSDDEPHEVTDEPTERADSKARSAHRHGRRILRQSRKRPPWPDPGRAYFLEFRWESNRAEFLRTTICSTGVTTTWNMRFAPISCIAPSRALTPATCRTPRRS